MTLAAYFLRTSFNHLRRGGQRVLVAVLCIAFGVMSLIAMLLLSGALEKMMVIDPPLMIGADISAGRVVEDNLLPEHIAQLDQLRASGTIDRYTLVSFTSNLGMRRLDSGELIIPFNALAINPEAYPLAGELKVGQPGNVGAGTLLQQAGDVLITRDLALNYGLQVGDALVLTDLELGAPLNGRVRGILIDTPNHQGSKVYFNAATAQALTGVEQVWDTAMIDAADPAAAAQVLNDSGWRAFQAEQLAANEAQARDLITKSLNGAGMLGLMVGGIGIANTMQVLLNRRRKEVAVWKTIGYRSIELQGLFACEALVMGTVGSLLGAGLGVLVSHLLLNLFSRTTTLLVEWTFSPWPVFTGIAVGILTTLIFALFAIVLSSRVPPLGLLRSEALHTARMPWLQSAGLLLALSVPLLAVTSLVMGSLLGGVIMLLVILAGLVGLGGVLAGLVWLITRLLPLRGLPLANLARNNLRRRGWGLVFAMIALFVGVVALTLSVVVVGNARRVMGEKTIILTGSNLLVFGPAGEESSIRAGLADVGASDLRVGYQLPVASVAADGADTLAIDAVLIARPDDVVPGDFLLSGAPWGSQPDGVYVPEQAGISEGSAVTVTTSDGGQHIFHVAGWYTTDYISSGPRLGFGLLLPNRLALEVTPPVTVQAYARVEPGQAGAAVVKLGRRLTGATTIDLLAYATRFTQQYKNIFVFSVAMAGLALLAGVLLLANSVSLAMLDRRYEMGVFKAMGYARRHLLSTLMVEYGLSALIAGAAGMAVVRVYVWLMALSNPLAGELFMMEPQTVVLIGLGCLGLTLLTVLLSTWQPVQVSPVVVLNDRD